MTLDRYLIPVYTSQELDVAIESFTVACEGDLSGIMQRASSAKTKIEKGNQSGNQQLVQAGKDEANEIKEELEEMDKQTTEPAKKSKIKTALKIILGILAIAGTVLGVSAGIGAVKGTIDARNTTLGELVGSGKYGTYDIPKEGIRVIHDTESQRLGSHEGIRQVAMKGFSDPWVKKLFVISDDDLNIKMKDLKKFKNDFATGKRGVIVRK